MPQTDFDITLFVIPCYNESSRLDVGQFSTDLFTYPRLRILFVNDGSTDNTLELLLSLREKFPRQVDVLNLKENKGKAEAVRAGMYYQLEKNDDFEYIGYLDADLATSIKEGLRLSNHLAKKEKLAFAFGSRISKVGSVIDRKTYRHVVGRVIATFISNILKLRVYDSQCGAKVFTKDLAPIVFLEAFKTTWLFDVEIFARILSKSNHYTKKNMIEVPLDKWIDKEGSKVKWSYMFRIFFDLMRIYSSYPDLKERKME